MFGRFILTSVIAFGAFMSNSMAQDGSQSIPN